MMIFVFFQNTWDTCTRGTKPSIQGLGPNSRRRQIRRQLESGATSSPETINFLWTQVKCNEYLAEMPVHNVYKLTMAAAAAVANSNNNEDDANNDLKKLADAPPPSSASSSLLLKYDDPVKRMICESNDEKKILLRMSDNVEQIGTRGIMIHNHFEHNGCLTTKIGLLSSLRGYFAAAKKDVFSTVPLTCAFYGESSFDEHWKQFVQVHSQFSPKSIWTRRQLAFVNSHQSLELQLPRSGFRKFTATTRNQVCACRAHALPKAQVILLPIHWNMSKLEIKRPRHRTYQALQTLRGRLILIIVFWFDQ
jgi:hypothetical protein